MAFDFPNAPTLNQVFGNYTWDGEKWAASGGDLGSFIQAGAGAVTRTMQNKVREIVSVLDFGADPTAVIDAKAAIQNAINSLSTQGGTVFVPRGTYGISANLTVPRLVTIEGAKGSEIRPLATMTRLLLVQDGLTAIRGLRLGNQGGLADRAIEVNKGFNNENVTVEDCHFTGFNYAVRWLDGDGLQFISNDCISNVNAVYSDNNCINSVFQNNYILGGGAYTFKKNTQGVEGCLIIGDIIMPSTSGATAIFFDGALNCTITNCIIDQLHGSSGINVTATNHTIDSVKLIGNWIGRNPSAAAGIGLYVEGGARNVVSAYNTYTGFQQAGIYLNGVSGAPTRDFLSMGDNFYWPDPCVRDIQIFWSSDVLIDGATHNATGQSIAESGGTITGRVINGNYTGSVLPVINGGLKYGAQRAGMVLRNRGTATIPSGGTTQVVNHGLSFTPDISNVRLTIGTITTTGSGDLAAGSFTSTQFSIIPRTAPGASMLVGWEIDLTR